MTDIKHILSFDCADKTLGVCLIGWLNKECISERLECVLSEDRPEYKTYYLNKLSSELIVVEKMWLFNLLPDSIVRDTEDAIRLGRLKFALMTIRRFLIESKININNVIVEYQMGQNDLSRLISAAIIYEFCTEDPNIKINIGDSGSIGKINIGDSRSIGDVDEKKTNNSINNSIIVIMPGAKNSFYFHPSLSYGNFAAKYKTNKTANKHHTSENFKHFLQLQNNSCSPYKFDTKINHSEINHIADAFMQAVYWIIEQWNH